MCSLRIARQACWAAGRPAGLLTGGTIGRLRAPWSSFRAAADCLRLVWPRCEWPVLGRPHAAHNGELALHHQVLVLASGQFAGE